MDFAEKIRILSLILAKTGGLKTKFASYEDSRAYYVWRMARFHGGVDCKMPVAAFTLCKDDPALEELEAMAVELAEKNFGTSNGAALVWHALGAI